jgi:fucose 4-O-acetylase-like acetyltransferase
MSSEEKVVALPAERSGWLIEVEALRAFSFVFIVFGHAVGMMASLSHGWLSMAAFGAVLGLTRFALLAFMTMSSLLIAKRIADGKSGSILRSAWRLVVPYTLFTVAYLLLERALAGGPPILAPQLAGQATEHG